MALEIALTERQFQILTRLQNRDVDRDGAETGREMVEALWTSGAFTSFEQGQRTCKQLVAKGLLIPLGYGPSNARCYGLAGRDGVHIKEAGLMYQTHQAGCE